MHTDEGDFVPWISVAKNKAYREKSRKRNQKRSKHNNELSNVEDSEGRCSDHFVFSYLLMSFAAGRMIPTFILQLNDEYQHDGLNDVQVQNPLFSSGDSEFTCLVLIFYTSRHCCYLS